tara:strand:- start:43 stop:597 length:555 start_codon:yes stop_codon:yes gene_type:complete
MIKRFLKRSVEAFGKTFDYDVTYMTDVLAHNTGAFIKLSLLQPMSQHCVALPTAAYYTAKVRAVLREDCGPCTQLCVNMALKAGVAPAVMRNVVSGEVEQLSEDVLLAFRFTEMCLDHGEEDNELRDLVLNCWGEDGLISLAFVIATCRVYPTMKYVLGHGQTCQRVVVGSDAIEIQALEVAHV